MDRRLRIVHVIPSLSTGGAEMTLARLIEHSSAERVEHVVIALSHGGALAHGLRERGVDIRELGQTASSPIAAFRRSLQAIRQLRPDIIHAWMYHANLIAGPIGRLLRVPTIWSLRISADPRGMTSSTWRLVRLLSGPLQWLPTEVVACSQDAATTHRHIGLRRHIDVVENGYEIGTIRPEEKREARIHFGLPTSSVVIGRPARWDPQKDHPTLLRAFAPLAKERPSVILLLAGTDIDDTNRELIERIDQLELRRNVLLVGEEHDMLRFYSACDLVCSSSVAEGFPNVLAEAMALGLPVVATSVGASARIVGNDGWLVPPSDATKLSRALNDAASMAADRRREIGEEGRSRIAEHFGIDRMVDSYERIYSALAGRST